MEVNTLDLATILGLAAQMAAMMYWGGRISARVDGIEKTLDRMYAERIKEAPSNV